MSEMLDKIKDMIERGEVPDVEIKEEARPPLEEAIDLAIFTLGEIALYATYGRAGEVLRETNELLTTIKALKEKYEEQQKMMDILSGRDTSDEIGGYS